MYLSLSLVHQYCNVQLYQIGYKNQCNITCVHVLVHFVILDSLIYRSCDLDKN